jgi:putative N6-adenine-specific DNA methylase
MAPGLGRTFALQDLVSADSALERRVREELLGKIDFNRLIRIYGSDADERALAIAKANLRRAYNLARGRAPVSPGRSRGPWVGPWAGPQTDSSANPCLPALRVMAMEDAGAEWPPEGGGDKPDSTQQTERTGGPVGFIVCNPPYGIRLGGPEEAEAIYRNMGEQSRRFPGWKMAAITDHPGFESHFGRKADSVREITNGAIHSYIFQYEAL